MVHRYERIRHISTGRFGLTMLVKGGGRLFVMKTIDTSRFGPEQRKELVREVSSLALLRHPHLDVMREAFTEGGSLCIVMEYVEGGCLAGVIEKARSSGGGLPEPRSLQWFVQGALALKYMHEMDVLHRDVRSRRLLLTPHGHVVLSGAATSVLLASSLAPERPELEAIRYLAPELLQGSCTHSRASDVWALGVVLFELLALRPPFEHSHPFLLAEQVRKRPLPPLPPHCGAELQQLCAALLQREVAERLSAAEALQEPIIQRRVLTLLADDALALPEKRVPGGGQAPLGSGHGVPGTPMRTWPSGGPRATGIRGPTILSTPLATPRSLQKVGERCLQKGAVEMKLPPAMWKRGKRPDAAKLAGAGDQTPRLALTAPRQRLSTANALGEIATGLLTEVVDDISLAGTHVLDGASTRDLGASGLLCGVESPSE